VACEVDRVLVSCGVVLHDVVVKDIDRVNFFGFRVRLFHQSEFSYTGTLVFKDSIKGSKSEKNKLRSLVDVLNNFEQNFEKVKAVIFLLFVASIK
jgi:hypothetical protein